MYKCKHFKIHELIPPEISYLPENILWSLMDDRILIDADDLREKYGKITINNWYWGGKFKYSGLRPFSCVEGAPFSQHKFGRALDMKFHDVPVDVPRTDLIDNPVYWQTTCVEMGVSWLHADVRNCDSVMMINP